MESGGKFKEYKIGNLFDIHPTKAYKMTNAQLYATSGSVPVVTNTSTNNGISAWIDMEPTERGGIITFSDTTTSDSIFYQPKDFVGYPHIQGLYPYDDKWTDKELIYFVSCFRKAAAGRFNYGIKFTRVIAKQMHVLLPTTNKNQIAFDYMSERVRELEEERVRELEAWLRAAGFGDCTLTEEEQKALSAIDTGTVKFQDIPIKKLFSSDKGNVDLQKSDINGKGEYFINSGMKNFGIKGKTDREAKVFPSNTITIDFFGIANYRPYPYKMATHNHVFSFSGDTIKNEDVGLFFVAASRYMTKKYSFNNMATCPVLEKETLRLPITQQGKLDYAIMQAYIHAIKKMCIARLKAVIENERKAYRKALE